MKTSSRVFPLVCFFILLLARSVEAKEEIRYVAIGDSYSIGTGVAPQQAWPVLLTELANKDGINMTLIANPSHNGWTAINAMEWEIPVLQKANANFVTLMIGVNDWVQGYPPERFRVNFADLLNDILLQVQDSRKVLIINIPDFSVTIAGSGFTPGRDVAKGIELFNKIIADEAKKRDVAVVNIFSISQVMGLDPSLVAKDGLHPSVKGQIFFADAIYPSTKQLLLNK